MTNQRIEIEVDIPEGYEATGEFRHPTAHDFRLCTVTGGAMYGQVTGRNAIILRKTWTWPAWLIAPWIAMDENGDWFAYEKEPQTSAHSCTWYCRNTAIYRLDGSFLAFEPPPCDDWRKSLRKNPNLADYPNS